MTVNTKTFSHPERFLLNLMLYIKFCNFIEIKGVLYLMNIKKSNLVHFLSGGCVLASKTLLSSSARQVENKLFSQFLKPVWIVMNFCLRFFMELRTPFKLQHLIFSFHNF